MASTLDLARLCAHVYAWNKGGGRVARSRDSGNDWTCVTRFGPGGVELLAGREPAPGFAAALYRSDGGNELVLAIRGTEVSDLDDLINDGMILTRLNPSQMHDARSALAKVRSSHPTSPVYLTGHSLGGGLAILLAAENPDLPVVTFNAPAMNGLAMTPTDLMKPGFGTLFRIAARSPVVVWSREGAARILHVRNITDPVSMDLPPDYRRNPGKRITLLLPPGICLPFPRFDRFAEADGPLCPHLLHSLISAIRAAPPDPLLHDDLRWLESIGPIPGTSP